MIRLVLAVLAIIVLALSAGFSHAPLQAPAPQVSSALQAFGSRQVMIADLDFGQPSSARKSMLVANAHEEGPAPALLAYLVLILVGSAIAIGMVRYSQGRESSS